MYRTITRILSLCMRRVLKTRCVVNSRADFWTNLEE